MQTGNIISVGPETWAGQLITNWVVNLTYLTDLGTTGNAQIIVGSGPGATVAAWTSPTGTITISGLPGTANPVTLQCPPLLAWATFEVPVRRKRWRDDGALMKFLDQL